MRLPRAAVLARAARSSPATASRRRSTRRQTRQVLDFMVKGIKDGAAPKRRHDLHGGAVAPLLGVRPGDVHAQLAVRLRARQQGVRDQGQVQDHRRCPASTASPAPACSAARSLAIYAYTDNPGGVARRAELLHRRGRPALHRRGRDPARDDGRLRGSRRAQGARAARRDQGRRSAPPSRAPSRRSIRRSRRRSTRTSTRRSPVSSRHE